MQQAAHEGTSCDVKVDRIQLIAGKYVENMDILQYVPLLFNEVSK